MPVTGPFRIYVDSTPTGVKLDVSHYLHAVLLSLAEAAAEDPEGLADELAALGELSQAAAHQGPDSHAVHERDARADALVAQFADEGTLPVYGAQVGALAESLRKLTVPRPMPGQPAEGGAAA